MRAVVMESAGDVRVEDVDGLGFNGRRMRPSDCRPHASAVPICGGIEAPSPSTIR